MTLDTDALIRVRAYEIWESENRPHGRDKEHWERAALEVAAESAKPVAKPRKADAKAVKSPVAKDRRAAPAEPVAPAKAKPVKASAPVKPAAPAKAAAPAKDTAPGKTISAKAKKPATVPA